MSTSNSTSDIPYGYCQCGCGQKTQVSKQTDKRCGSVKGVPYKFCHGHHGRYSYQEAITNFWDNVAITADDNQCWLWMAGCSTEGYGNLQFMGKFIQSHRLAWICPDYVIPEGMLICHSCDNPKCCNPKHLFIGTHQDNSDDKFNKGRENPNKGEDHPKHKLTESQVKEIRTRYAQGGITQKELANEYGVVEVNINTIINRKIWKHVK